MKNTASNTAAKAAKPLAPTQTQTASTSTTKRQSAREKMESTSITLLVKVNAFEYGLLCAGALVNGCSPAEAAGMVLNETDALCIWHGQSFNCGNLEG